MKAVALISGGLDSTLATQLILKQGIGVVALNFVTPFCLCDKKSKKGTCRHEAAEVAKNLGIRCEVRPLIEELFPIIKDPPHGYGSNMNPCIDCRILIFKKAKEFMGEIGASFLITGEVVGQRPMSQKAKTIALIEHESGLDGLIVRPLSAQLLPLTIPEQNGWVDRSKLLALNGRSRKPQIALAEEFNIKDYPCAAGGCLLTDAGFSNRLRDLLAHGDLSRHEAALLKVGRHLRLSSDMKLIVGRDAGENDQILNLLQDNDMCFQPYDTPGPTALGRGVLDEGLIILSAQIVGRYCDKNKEQEVKIVVKKGATGETRVISAQPASDELIQKLLL